MRPSAEVTRDWVRALEAMQRLHADPAIVLASEVAAQARIRPGDPALIGSDIVLTYADLEGRCNRVARWGLAQGLSPGDVVALLMPNQPDYVAIWLGLTRIGCVVALLNTHLMADAQAHCLRAAGAAHVIVADSLAEMAEAAGSTLPPGLRWHAHRAGALFAPFGAEPPDRPSPISSDGALLIYTSGTTGLPKAARVTHARVMEWSAWFAAMMDAKPDDRLYDCLPMYHSVGGVVAIGAMLLSGGSVVIRERFSARNFWDDVADTGCTIAQYIGELCRYLLQSPAHAKEKSHRLRLFCGNGLRGEVWEPFQERFAIPRILEFYAATEGSVSLTNAEGKPGAIGRVPGFLAHRFPVALIRCDPVSGEPLRGADGLCQLCAPDEPGEAIGRIGASQRRFDGYTDAAASEKKLLHDAFTPGDRWFRTGDLMRKDAARYYYFVDRLGDTFRWKGENVATAEVAGIVGTCPGVVDAVVFGVEIPGTEGRAGMAALVVDETFDIGTLRQQLKSKLPSYARPIYVRLCQAIDATGTFKLKKIELARQGYRDCGADPVYAEDSKQDTFVLIEGSKEAVLF